MRAALIAIALSLAASAANAAVILTFGQTEGTPVTATANAAGTQTTITAVNAPVDITEILGGSPVAALFDLNITSVDAAAPLGGGGEQHYAGSFSLFSGGTNYLSGSFTDIVLGVGPSGVLAAGSPPDTITLTSDVITDLLPPSAISLSFAGLTPAFSIDGATIGSFTSSVSGTFSASPAAAVPEPASLAALGAALFGLIALRRKV